MLPRLVGLFPSAAAAITALALLPGAASAAVPRSGHVFSPRTGAELLEAADLIAAESAMDPDQAPVVRLEATEYLVDRPVVLGSYFAPTLEGPATGRAVITNAGEPGTLLRLWSLAGPNGGRSGARRVDVTVRGSSTRTFAAVDLESGGTFAGGTVRVPASTPNATAVRLAPGLGPYAGAGEATIEDAAITSEATAAPAVRAGADTRIDRSTLTGGSPTLDLGEDGDDAVSFGGAFVDRSRITGGPQTSEVVRIQGGRRALAPQLASTVVDGTAGAATLVSIQGATAAGPGTDVVLGQLGLRGANQSTAIRVAPGPTAAGIRLAVGGLLTTGSATAIGCTGTAAAPATVDIAGIHRAGDHATGAHCTLTEQDRRTGPLLLRPGTGDDRTPSWNSPLVDGVDQARSFFGTGLDLAGQPRWLALRDAGRSGDIGPFEYQPTPPQVREADWGNVGNRGLTVLLADAVDPDPLEDPDLQLRWTLPDGTTSTEPVFVHRFTTTAPQRVQLTVTDVSGLVERRTLEVHPWIVPSEPASDDPDYEPSYDDIPDGDDGYEPVPEDEPISGGVPTPRPFAPPGQGQAPPRLGPRTTATPRPTPTKAPKVDPGPVFTGLQLVRGRISRKAVVKTGLGAPRRGEGAVRITTTRRAAMQLTVERLRGKKATAIPKATQPLRAFTGTQTLRLSTRIGGARLKPGVYRVTISATYGEKVDRQSVRIRILAR